VGALTKNTQSKLALMRMQSWAEAVPFVQNRSFGANARLRNYACRLGHGGLQTLFPAYENALHHE
jgi:hypothetical protein